MDPVTLVRETVLVPRKTPRPPGPDDWASERIRYEREQRGWSTAELARRVTLTGVTLRQPQVWQIESGTPRRKLSVGEAMAFAKVFGLSLAELMTPPEEIAELDLIEVGRAFMEWQRDAGLLAARCADIARRIEDLGDEDTYTATTFEKFSGYEGVAEQVAEALEGLAGDYRVIAESVRNHRSPWSVIASMRDLVSPAEAGPPQRQPIVAAIVTSGRGVLITARKDGNPPWGFVTGEVEPGERPEDACWREVKEETGLEVRPGQMIGERDHPQTGRHLIYMAAEPVRSLEVAVGDEAELSEVRWASLAEAEELLPGMFGPVREHLAAVIGDRS